MIVLDASVVIPWLEGDDVSQQLDLLVSSRKMVIAPVTLAELLAGPTVNPETASVIEDLRVLGLHPGYWRRTGLLRRRMLQAKRRARLGDTLLAQACLDHDLPLLARDSDFEAFADIAGLKLA